MSTVEEEPKELIQDIAQKSVGDVLPNESLNASTIEEETKRAKIEWTTRWEERRQSFPLEVTVSLLDYHHFKNRYSVEEGLAIIEVLKGHQNIEGKYLEKSYDAKRSLHPD